MRVLLDTHIALWAIFNDPRLSARARSAITDNASEVYVSVVSLWEIAIKFALRRGRPSDMPIPAAEAAELFVRSRYQLLPVLAHHALAVAELPMSRTDPFDRMLVAQARSEPLRLLTADSRLAAYGDGVELV